LPVTFGNPMSVPIYVTSLTVDFTNAFPSGCLPSWFQLGGSSPPDGTSEATINLPTPLAVPAGSADSPGTTQYAATLALANVDQNQDACKNLPLTLSYSARAYYTVQTATSLSVSASGSGGSHSLTLRATVAPDIGWPTRRDPLPCESGFTSM
jgi:hypothetical protein